MTAVTRGWPPSRRKLQAERIRALQPWLRSTGPRTPTGKARSRMNALRHGMRSLTMRRIKHLMHRQRIFLRYLDISFQHAKTTDLSTRHSPRMRGIHQSVPRQSFHGSPGQAVR